MGLLSFFKRNIESPAGDVPAADAVAQARVRARRRLIGATVLLGIGVIGFPLLFETQPRPIPVDIPIEIPRKESAPPLVLPTARAPVAAPAATPSAPRTTVPAETPAADAPAAASTARPAAPPIVTERAADQGRELSAPASAPAARTAAAPASAVARSTTEAQRAQALLEGRAAPPKASEPGSMRLVVQVGAYTDADKLREARQKVEKLGMKTYTQVVEGEGAKRTRVRVGPFASRDEADRAAARIRSAGYGQQVLTL
jgi:DedD protein